jgi:diguanylate cyclase (GGDEF)-like protein
MQHKKIQAALNNLPLRTVLIVPFVALILIAVGINGYFSYFNGKRAVEEVTSYLTEQIASHIEQHLINFLETPAEIDTTNADLIQHGLLDPTNPIMLQQYFLSEVQLNPTITSIYFGNPRGGIVGSGREGPKGSLYTYATDEFQPGVFRKFSADPSGRQGPLITKIDPFDARSRVWYQKAVNSGKLSSSDVYILSTGQDLAIATSLPVFDDQNNFVGVVSVDLFLSHLNSFMHNLVISPSGLSFIIQNNGLMVANSVNEALLSPTGEGGKMQRLSADKSQTPLIQAAAKHILQTYGKYNLLPYTVQNLQFQVNGKKQFALIRPLKEMIGLDWFIVVVVPQDDFMGQIEASYRTNLAISLVAMLVAAAISILLAHLITRPIHQLAENSHALAAGNWAEIQGQPTKIAEISILTAAFNQMIARLRQSVDNMMVEISERKQIEETLRHSEEKATELLRAAQNHADELHVIDQIGRAVLSVLDFDQMLQTLYEQCQSVLEVDVFYVAIYDENTHMIHHPLFIDKGVTLSLPPRDIRTNPGLSGYVIEHQKTLYIPDTSLPEATANYNIIHTGANHACAYVGVPMIVRNHVVGMMSMQTYTPNAYTPEEIYLLEIIADRVAAAVEHSRLFAEIQANSKFIDLLNQVTLASLETTDLDAMMQTLADRLGDLFNADDCHITHWDDDEQRTYPVAASNGQTPHYKTLIPDTGEVTLTASVIQLGKPLAIFDVTTSPYISKRIAAQFSAKSLLGLPLIAGDQNLGAVILGFNEPHEFNENEIVLGRVVASQVALAIAKSELVVSDPLTKVYNRRGLINMGSREFDRSKRYFTNLSAIFFDIDHFKQINDQFGHDVGDQVLRAVAQRTRKCVRMFDIIGRYGGEEFCVLLPETELEAASALAERLCEYLGKTPITTSGGVISVTVSIGVSSLNRVVQDLEGLIKAADQGMYAAKEAGRNQVKISWG